MNPSALISTRYDESSVVLSKKNLLIRMPANRVSCHSMLYDINPADFAHHVRHATSWNDLGVRCGFEIDEFGTVRNRHTWSILQQKTLNMQLNTEHFYGQQPKISDDDFKTIVKESDSLAHVLRKCGMTNGGSKGKKILKRIEGLGIDMSHFKLRNMQREYKLTNKLDAIDDETFKTLVKNNTTWINLIRACGYTRFNGMRKKMTMRIEKLGLDTNHFDKSLNEIIPVDKVFVVDSKYHCTTSIKKRMLTDFNFPYECAGCQNQNFTKCDGVLIWNKQKIVLQLEHKNGINNDNRIENLEFLCPNCHSQTSTYGGGNTKKSKVIQVWIEEGKTSHVPGSIASLLN